MKFRKLKASEIDARVATVSDQGCSLLLYKDARVDQNILDETVGPENWQRSHELINGNLFCNVGIKVDRGNEYGEWVWKQDVGTESYTEKEKGQASDAFKRACFNWGIGRELYTAPFIWISASKFNLTDKNGKKTTYDSFKVDDIGYDDEGTINRLVIRNMGSNFKKRDEIVYQFGEATTEEQKNVKEYEKVAQDKITDIQLKSIKMTIEKNPGAMSEEGICKYFKIKKLEDMTTANLSEWMQIINGGGKK